MSSNDRENPLAQSVRQVSPRLNNFYQPRAVPKFLCVYLCVRRCKSLIFNSPYADSIPARCKSLGLIDILLRDRHATTDAESETRHFQSGGSLLAFVLV
jgi:hypothetical protein